jgi:hypothetical protein
MFARPSRARRLHRTSATEGKCMQAVSAFQMALLESACQPPNKQLERTVIRRCVRAASAPFHYALAARWTAQRAAAQLRR